MIARHDHTRHGPEGSARRHRARIGAAIVWVLWAVNLASDLVSIGHPTPFTLVMLAALGGGQALVWLGVVPNPMPRRWATLTFVAIAAVATALAAYVVLHWVAVS